LTIGLSRLSASLPRRALFLVGLAFLVRAGHAAASQAFAYAAAWDRLSPLFRLQAQLAFAALAAVLAAPVVAAALAIRSRRSVVAAGTWHMAVAVLLAVGTGLVAHAVILRGSDEEIRWTRSSLNALWQLALVGLATFAIVRFRFLDLEVRVRRGIAHGVVAGSFVATFFVFTEGLATFLGEWAESRYLGILVTGSLVFALAPLRRFGERVAGMAMPHAVAPEERSVDERIALFAEQTRIAWEDEVLTVKERHMLDATRARLGLSELQAARIERQVLHEVAPAPVPPPLRLAPPRHAPRLPRRRSEPI